MLPGRLARLCAGVLTWRWGGVVLQVQAQLQLGVPAGRHDR
jgi:hypothetical protein